MVKHSVKRPAPLLIALLAVLLLFNGGCQTRQKGRKPSPDWSRGVPVGVLVRGNIDMVVEQKGEGRTHLVWLQEENERQVVHYLQLDARAGPLVDRSLELPGDQLRHPHIAETAGPNLQLIWSTRQNGRSQWDLWAGQLDPQGDLMGDPVQVAASESEVGAISMAPDGRGGVYIVWESAADGAVYGAQISSTGEFVQEPLLLVRRGESPSVAADDSGMKLVWFDQGDVRFAAWPGGELAEHAGDKVAGISLGTGQTLDGPVLGLAGDWAYVLWSIYSSSGLEAGTAVAKYVAFPKEAAILSSGETIRLSTVEDTPYAPIESEYQISQLAPPASIGESSGLVRQPHPAAGRGDELAVAIISNQERKLDAILQPGVLLFKDGVFTGYEMAGKTEAFSQEPVLAADAAGNLFMSWREGGRGTMAYYALTTDAGKDTLDRMSGGDIATTVLSGGMEMIAGMLFFPLACIWIFPGLLLVGILHLGRGDSDMSEALTIVVLLIAILISQVIKLAFLPTISFYVPFSAWVDVSAQWEDVLRIAVPFMTVGIGLLVALYMRRRNSSALAFFFIFVAVDAVLTLAIYGVNILGVF